MSLRLGKRESSYQPTPLPQIDYSTHTGNCCLLQYTNDINLKDREQFNKFDDWLSSMIEQLNKIRSKSTSENFRDNLIMFSYSINELKNQLKME